MKVLYLGHYRERSGWANAAINNILALDSVGVDVVCRNVSLTDRVGEPPARILELENKVTKDATHCIQHLLPHHLVGTSIVQKNVAYFASETIDLQKNIWHYNLKLMDEVWVGNTTQLDNISKFIDKAKIMPYSFNCKAYQAKKSTSRNSRFSFYHISDINQRKNIESIVRCYYHTFDISDPVQLILKVKKLGVPPENLQNGVENICVEIKKQMRKYTDQEFYPLIKIIASEYTDEQIQDLHKSSDCYVGVSRGEDWSIPAYEAMLYGNTPICSNEGGPKDFIDPQNKNTGTLINGVYDICNQQDGAFDHLFTGRELWFHASEKEICDAMRYYYNNKDLDKSKTYGMQQAQKFDYSAGGNKIKELLNV